MARLWNRRYPGVPEDAVSIERPSDWGNPFKVTTGRSRSEAVSQHREWVLSQPEYMEKVRRELRGKDLVCCCHPKPCHGDVLLEVANDNSDLEALI